MKIASVADIKARLSAYLKVSQEGPVVVTRNGKAIAVLLAVTDDDELERLVLAHSPRFQALLASARKQIDQEGGIGHVQFWQEVESETAEVLAPSKPVRHRSKPRIQATKPRKSKS
jgi:prevent-host-death family protein